MHTHFRAMLAGAVLACCPLAARADILIDSFVDRNPANWPMTITSNTAGLTGTSEIVPTVPGGERGEAIGNSTMAVPGFDSATADIFNQSGFSFFDYHSTVGAAATAQLSYGDTVPMNIDGVTSLLLSFMDYDAGHAGPLHISATLYHEVSLNVFQSQTYTLDMATPGAQTAVIPTDFAFGDVDRMVIDFEAPSGVDYRIDSISVVTPEPASLALLGLAVPLMWRRKRHVAHT